MSRVAIAQTAPSADKERNLKSALRCIRDAARRGASLCAFPEFLMIDAPAEQSARELARQAEPLDGPFVSRICEAAREHSVEVVGTICEPSKVRDRVYDTAFLASKSGRVAGAYRKTHLYDALGFCESAKLAPGETLPRPRASSVGKLGMLICYDLRFPEVSRHLASLGARVLVAPSAWHSGPMKVEHWRVMNRARALENGCYVVAPNQAGGAYCGRSMAVDPFGRVLAEMGGRPGMRLISVESVDGVRRSLPLLKNRRTDLYR